MEMEIRPGDQCCEATRHGECPRSRSPQRLVPSSGIVVTTVGTSRTKTRPRRHQYLPATRLYGREHLGEAREGAARNPSWAVFDACMGRGPCMDEAIHY